MNNYHKPNEEIFSLLKYFRKYKTFVSLFLIITLLNFSACSYYKVTHMQVPVPNANEGIVPKYPATDLNAALTEKYVILHKGEQAWHLANAVLNDDKQTLSGYIEVVPFAFRQYENTDTNHVNRYKRNDADPTYQLHIYVSEFTKGGGSGIIIPLSNIKKIEVYDEAVGATTASYIFSGIGIAAGVTVVLGVIILLTKSSCPFVYISDGQTYTFAGEMYGGATAQPLERDDYLSLPGFAAVDGIYTLKIANDLLERQYTNIAELFVAEHPAGTKLAVDANGNAQLISNPISPVIALTGKSADKKDAILAQDLNSYIFDEPNNANETISSLILSFPRPLDVDTGKFFINAKNSYWLDYMYGEFTKLFGTRYLQFAEKQKTVPTSQSRQWALDQNIPLSIYLETEKGWELVDYLNVTGPLASRDFVLPIDISKVQGQTINIKLECGFMFWEVDYAVMDFTPNENVILHKVSIASAFDENGTDVASKLIKTDNEYLFQPIIGNQAILKFNAPQPAVNSVQTCFLHSRGYYEYIRDFKNEPDLEYLKTFKNKGSFTRFARDRYNYLLNEKDLISNVFQSTYEVNGVK